MFGDLVKFLKPYKKDSLIKDIKYLFKANYLKYFLISFVLYFKKFFCYWDNNNYNINFNLILTLFLSLHKKDFICETM